MMKQKNYDLENYNEIQATKNKMDFDNLKIVWNGERLEEVDCFK